MEPSCTDIYIYRERERGRERERERNMYYIKTYIFTYME
jgi:hypothetical protein